MKSVKPGIKSWTKYDVTTGDVNNSSEEAIIKHVVHGLTQTITGFIEPACFHKFCTNLLNDVVLSARRIWQHTKFEDELERSEIFECPGRYNF